MEKCGWKYKLNTSKTTTSLWAHLKSIHSIDPDTLSPPPKQETLTSLVKPTSQFGLDKALAVAVVSSSSSLALLDNPEFRGFLALLNPSYVPPKRNLMTSQIKKLATEMRTGFSFCLQFL